jgi:hypothetical protein
MKERSNCDTMVQKVLKEALQEPVGKADLQFRESSTFPDGNLRE